MVAPAEGRRGDVRPQGLGDLGNHPRLLRRAGRADRRRVLHRPTRIRSTDCCPARSTSPGTRRSRGSTRSGDPGNGCRAIAMRDTDRDRISYFVARRSGPVQTLADLRGRTIATGAIDSPQATLIPLGRLRREGLSPGVGRHGPAVRRARRQARRSRRRRARRAGLPHAGRRRGVRDARPELGRLDQGRHDRRRTSSASSAKRIVSTTASSPSARRSTASAEKAWLDALFAMRYDNPAHREMMDLEGLKAWLPGRTTGFGPLTAAVESERFFDGAIVVSHAAALSGHDRRQLAAAAEGRRGDARRIAAAGSTARNSIASPTRRWSICCACRRRLGCDIVTDGELRRDNFYSFVAEKLAGVRLMTLAEMLDVVEDKAGFEQLLQTLDVPAYSISSPICVGAHRRGASRWRSTTCAFARRHTDLPIKVTLPGPYLLTRAMFVPELTRAYYPDKEALAEDVVALLRAELEELAIGRRGLRAVRRAGPDRAGLRARADADVHVRGARRAQRSGRGARVRRLADQSSGRGRRRRAARPARLPRQLEPRRDDAA